MLGCLTFRSTATSFSMRCSWKHAKTRNPSEHVHRIYTPIKRCCIVFQICLVLNVYEFMNAVKIIWIMWWWIKHYQPNLTVLDKRIRQAHTGDPVVERRRWGGKISQTFPLHFALLMIFSANSFPVDLNRNSTIRAGNKKQHWHCNCVCKNRPSARKRAAVTVSRSYWKGKSAVRAKFTQWAETQCRYSMYGLE